MDISFEQAITLTALLIASGFVGWIFGYDCARRKSYNQGFNEGCEHIRWAKKWGVKDEYANPEAS